MDNKAAKAFNSLLPYKTCVGQEQVDRTQVQRIWFI